MSEISELPNPDQVKPGLAIRVEELRAALRLVLPDLLAERSGATYQMIGPGRGEFRLSLFDTPLIVTFPNLISINQNDDEMPVHIQALMMYYLRTSDGSPLGNQWVSFAELPDGRVYNQAFQGYSGNELAKAFGLEVESFRRACEKNKGVKAEVGDAAYIFQALPHVPLLVTYGCGDEDFPSNCKFLFDANVSHYLPTDVCAILGSMLTKKILKAKG
jgi:hypothetical protein